MIFNKSHIEFCDNLKEYYYLGKHFYLEREMGMGSHSQVFVNKSLLAPWRAVSVTWQLFWPVCILAVAIALYSAGPKTTTGGGQLVWGAPGRSARPCQCLGLSTRFARASPPSSRSFSFSPPSTGAHGHKAISSSTRRGTQPPFLILGPNIQRIVRAACTSTS